MRLASDRNWESVMTIAVIGDEATTSALRTVSLRIAISPKKSPGPRSAMCSSPRMTSAVPFSITKNS